MRRMFFLFMFMLFLSMVGAMTLISTVFRAGSGGGGFALVGLSIPLVVVAILFTAVLLTAGMRRLAGPLGSLMEAANRIGGGDYSVRVTTQGPRGVRTVGSAFNSMAEKLRAQDRQRRDLMADIAHELRTPLSVIQGQLEGLLDGVYERDDSRLEQVLDETRTLARLVEDLRTLAHSESGMLSLQKEPTDLAVLAQDVVDALSAEAQTRHVTVKLDAPANLPLVSVDPLRIREVLTNLLSNALRHTPEGGRVTIELTPAGERIAVAVTDTSRGIPAEELPKIFDRFYKGPESKGAGLGLTIARNLVTAHGGDIRAESRVDAGTIIMFTL